MLLGWDVQDSPWRMYRNQFDQVLVDPQWSDTPVGFGRLRICQNNLLFPLQIHTPRAGRPIHTVAHTPTPMTRGPLSCASHTPNLFSLRHSIFEPPTHLSAQATGSQLFVTGHPHVAVDTSWQPGAITCGTEHQNKWGSRIGMVLE